MEIENNELPPEKKEDSLATSARKIARDTKEVMSSMYELKLEIGQLKNDIRILHTSHSATQNEVGLLKQLVVKQTESTIAENAQNRASERDNKRRFLVAILTTGIGLISAVAGKYASEITTWLKKHL